jgi:hypothetical protein
LTKLVEHIKVQITLNHDEVNSAVYYGNLDLWAVLERIWPKVCPTKALLDGHIRVPGVSIEWKLSGLEEEHEAGDN